MDFVVQRALKSLCEELAKEARAKRHHLLTQPDLGGDEFD